MVDMAAQILIFIILLIVIGGCSAGMIAICIMLFRKKTPEEQIRADKEQMEWLKKRKEERSKK